jgi:hypothetical protein
MDKIVEIVTEELTYLPNPDQRKLKSAFWARVQDLLPEGTPITRDLVAQYVQDSRLQKWWSSPGFPEWFSNSSEFRDKLENLAYKMLEVLDEVASNPKQQGSARIAAAKLVFELAEKMPSRQQQQEGKILDTEIGKMSKHELEDYISKNVRLVAPASKK